jgi:hypothetical protein
MTPGNAKRWIWPALCAVLSLALAWALWTNHLLRGHVALCNRAVAVQAEWCDGLKQVNELCEGALLDIGARLGLDTAWMPLVTTALWKRAAKGVGVSKARAVLGASAWQKDPPLGGESGVGSGMGGGEDADERPRKRGRR